MNKIQTSKKINSAESRFGFLLLLPGLAVFCFIILYPFVNSIRMSFTDQTIFSPKVNFIWFDNFIRIFSDPNFPNVIKNTLIFVVFGASLPFVIGFIWALVLNQKFRGSELMRGVTLVCWIIPSTSIGFLWMWIFHGHYGVLNAVLTSLGIIENNITWLGQISTAMPVVIIAKTWQSLPWFMSFLLAGLQSIPHETIESSRIDGAGNLRVFWHIVLPEMKYIITLVLTLSVIGSLQHFDLLWVMTQGGPARATTTLSVEVYSKAFMSFKLGLAASVGTIWVVLLAVIGFIYLRRVKDEI